MDTKKSPEVWDQLTNESGRAYEAFKVYMYMSPAERTVVGAWRLWTENPEAARPSPFFEEWARECAWEVRARAYDAHIDFIRRRGMEQAIEDEARKQARDTERRRQNLSGLMKQAYSATEEFLENVDPKNMRFSDAVRVIRLHIEHVDKFGGGDEGQAENEWTEEDDEAVRKAAERVRRRRMERDNRGVDSEAEEDSKSDTDEDRSEESEGDET